MKIKHIIFMGLLSFIFGCEKPDFDKLVYETYNGSLPPEHRERQIIEVTKNGITFTSFSANDKDFKLDVKQSQETKIDSTDFEKIKKMVYNAGVIKCKSSDDCDGGGTHTITGHKGKKVAFSNTHYGCKGNCSGFYDLLEFLGTFRKVKK